MFKYLNISILRYRAGFSLIELMLVIAITAILATVGTTNYLSLRESKSLDAAAQKLAADLRLASDKSKSQENNSGWGIVFDSAGDYYEFASGSGWISSSCPISALSPRTNLLNINFISVPADNIRFARGTGLPINSSCSAISSPITITISSRTDCSSASKCRTITVNTNGRISYE